MKSIFTILIFLFLVASCVPSKYKATEKMYKKQLDSLTNIIAHTIPVQLTLDSLSNVILKKEPLQLSNTISTEWISTTNFNLRKPNFIIIHHTAQDSLQQTISTFTKNASQVSAHYVIGKDGKVVQMLNDYLRAWHAGSSSWGKITDINSSSIGIELDNNGKEAFTNAQINSLLSLLEKLKITYNIPTQNIIGHSDIAPGRKTDPSIFFPWQKLSEQGFGLWTDSVLLVAPVNFDVEQALRIIGYDTKNLDNAIKSFKLHYIQEALIDATLDQKTLDTLYSIYKKQ